MDKAQELQSLKTLYEQFQQLHKEYAEMWLNNVFLHWDWWVSLTISLGIWIFWAFYRKKESTHRLLYAGFFAMLISVTLDYIGASFGLWYYTGTLIPSFPAWFPFNFCLKPVTIMLLIQTKPHIVSWKKGILYGLLTAFVGEPIFVWTGYYVMTGWKYIYSAPIYALIFIFCDWLTKRDTFERVSEK